MDIYLHRLMCGCCVHLMEETEAGELGCSSIRVLRHEV